MDIAVSMTSNDHAPSPYETLHPVNAPTSPSSQTHRNLQASISDLAPIRSPRRFHAPQPRTSPPAAAAATLDDQNMDVAPTSLAANATQSNHHNILRNPHSPAVGPTLDGQDHDRMETDEDSSSEDEQGTHQLTTQTPFENEEFMDTTPDELHGEDNLHDHDPAPTSSTPNHQVLPITDGGLRSSQEAAEPERPDVTQEPPGPGERNVSSSLTTPGPTIDPIAPPAAIAPHPPEDNNPPPDANGTRLEDAPTPPPVTIDEPSSPQHEVNDQGEPEQQQAREDDSSQEESSDEEERPYWAEFVEDTSGPDEREMEIIEREASEVDARNHAHWEAMTYEALEDPEYIPLESGRITWTATPINGTPGNPNRDKIMRSPSVLIGGLYWNIKYYPRGNDGTEHMSVYVECSPSPPETSDPEEGSDASPNGENVASVSNVPHDAVDTVTISQPGSVSSAPPHIQEVEGTDSEADSDSNSARWEAAAQVGCVVYNPNEARVNVFRKSNHQFNPGDADWGWTRFHGPWESIHLRQRNERQALLRNDTLAFCAYIRVVKDDTMNLWWHAPKKGPGWESYEKIGVKSLSTRSSRDSNIVAALSCWLNLKPVVDLIKSIKIPDFRRETDQRMRPLSETLQQLIEYMFEDPEDTSHNAMAMTTAWLDWYITETDPPRFDLPDVVTVWECLRRLLNYEASGKGDIAAAPDCFQDILLLKQPDPWKTKSPISAILPDQEDNPTVAPLPKESRSVQEIIDRAVGSNEFRRWEIYAGNSPESHDLPAILQIELHRQQYNSTARRWDRLTHRIEMNENITYTSPKMHTSCNYTLFGMVVHSGCLESRDFYSVIRPQGPGTRWIRYSGAHLPTCCLTRTQAITAHEGEGESETGNAAVAYIVIYVRTDAISDILIPPFSPPIDPPHELSHESPSGDEKAEDLISVRAFKSTLFDSHSGRGLPDLWPPDSVVDSGSLRDLQFPKSTALIDVTKRFEIELPIQDNQLNSTDSRPIIYRWWYLDTSLNSPRGLPRFKSIWDETLEKAAMAHGGVRLWLHVYQSEPSTDNTDVPMPEVESSAEVQAPSNPDGDESGDAVMTQDPPVESITEDGAREPPAQTNDAADASTHQAPLPPAEDAPNPTSHEHGDGGNDTGDAVMNEGQEPTIAPNPPSAILTAPFIDTIYIFVKIFDSQEQTLRAIGSRVVSKESGIHYEVTRLLESEDQFDIYHENSRSISDNDRIRPSRSFVDYDFRNGSVFIAHRKPTAEEIQNLISQGKPPNPPSFFDYLRYNDDPGYLVTHDVNNSFGSEYTSASISNGFIHGPGTVIYMNGDAYIGNWTANQRSGHGTMAYASGDTYTGDFAHNEREGQGKMVYASTNNVYEGGWKAGRRHGKGVMRFEVADEEMAMCRICYESEMDALLYDCGHVVACEECARQLELCPVCRKGVRGVCRIWRT